MSERFVEWAFNQGDIVILGSLFIWGLLSKLIVPGWFYDKVEKELDRVTAVNNVLSDSTARAARVAERATGGTNE